MDLQLNRIRQLLDHLGSPEKRLKSVHITGTNGKGTVGCYLSAILCKASRGSIKIGTFTSPHLIHPRDCIRINTCPVSLVDYERLVDAVEKADLAIGAGCTSFEKLTAAAFLCFAEEETQICVIEVGLGGRLDATNVIPPPELCLFTAIGLDHVEVLGGTIESIAREKSGIIKKGTPVISTCGQQEAALSVIQGTCKALKVPFTVAEIPEEVKVAPFSAPQRINLALSISAFRYLRSKFPDLIIALELQDLIDVALNTTWPGRMEWLDIAPLGLVLVDGAHNEPGLIALREYASSLNKPITWVLGFKGGKDLEALFRIIIQNGDQVVFTEYESVEGMPWIKCATYEDMKLALKKISITISDERAYHHISDLISSRSYRKPSREEVDRELASASRIHIVCGSLYLISSLYKYIQYEI